MKPNTEIIFVIAIVIFVVVFLAVPLGFAVSSLRRMWRDREWLGFVLIVGIFGLVVSAFVGALVAAAVRGLS